MKELFKNKNYFLLFQGSLISAIGNSLYGFAAALYVQDMYKEVDPAKGALFFSLIVFISIFLSVVLSPLAGVLVDKWNKIRILYMTDWIRGVLFVLVFLVLQSNANNDTLVLVLMIATAISSVNQAFFSPASASVIPEVVGNDMIQQANGANSIIQSVQTIAGVVVGMLLYEFFGFEYVVLLNAGSFMLSAFSEMFIKTNFTAVKEEITLKSFFTDFKFGFDFIKKKEGLMTMMLFSLALNFAFAPLFIVGIPYLLRTELSSSTFAIGALDIVFSVAMLIGGVYVGSMTIKSLNKTVKKGVLSLSLSFIMTSVFVLLVTYGFIDYKTFYILFLIANVLLAFTMMYTNVPVNTAMMKAIDQDVRGRVFGTIGALSQGAIPFAILIAGQVIIFFNTAILAVLCSILVIIVGFVYVRNDKITTLLNNIEEDEKKSESINEISFE